MTVNKTFLSEMNFLSIGTDIIIPELFQNIKNNPENPLKPTGGFWATEYHESYKYFSPWLDFACVRKDILYRYYQLYGFKPKGVYFSINQCSNIFILDSFESYMYLLEHFGNNGVIDFEAMAQVYDGVYVNVFALNNSDNDVLRQMGKTWGVSSLVVFNLTVINCFQSVNIDIEEKDIFDFTLEPLFYIINVEKGVHKVSHSSKRREELIEIMREFVHTNGLAPIPENMKLLLDIYGGEILHLFGSDNPKLKKTLTINKVLH